MRNNSKSYRVVSDLYIGGNNFNNWTDDDNPFCGAELDLSNLISMLKDTINDEKICGLILNGNIFDNWVHDYNKNAPSIRDVIKHDRYQ